MFITLAEAAVDNNQVVVILALAVKVVGTSLAEVSALSICGALDWFDGLAPGMQMVATRPRGPNVGVVLGPDAAEKSRNLRQNLREGRIQVVQGLFTL